MYYLGDTASGSEVAAFSAFLPDSETNEAVDLPGIVLPYHSQTFKNRKLFGNKDDVDEP